MFKALKSEKVFCECCGKELVENIITIVSLARSEELILCVNCFNGMTAQKIWETVKKAKSTEKA